jgi:prepilin-type N-terminal cleavage/methylation domain-containing protein
MRLARDLRRRAADERAFTLTEMVVVLVILSTVLSALIGVFVSTLRTEVDQNQRFEAQQNARVALDKLRREVHCAATANVQNGGATVTLTATSNPTGGYCRGGDSTWCVLPAGSGFTLYRGAGATCDASSLLMAEHLTSGLVFSYSQPPGSLATLGVDLRIDRDPASAQRTYRLFDAIVLRGSARG